MRWRAGWAVCQAGPGKGGMIENVAAVQPRRRHASIPASASWWHGQSWWPCSSAPPTPRPQGLQHLLQFLARDPVDPVRRRVPALRAWTLLSNEHIRIDIVNSMLPKRVRDWIDVFGHVFFLIPMALLLVYLGWPFFWRSLMQNEQSTNAGGLPVYPSKLLIPLGVHVPARAGDLGADQAHRHHQGRLRGHSIGRRTPRRGGGGGASVSFRRPRKRPRSAARTSRQPSRCRR